MQAAQAATVNTGNQKVTPSHTGTVGVYPPSKNGQLLEWSDSTIALIKDNTEGLTCVNLGIDNPPLGFTEKLINALKTNTNVKFLDVNVSPKAAEAIGTIMKSDAKVTYCGMGRGYVSFVRDSKA